MKANSNSESEDRVLKQWVVTTPLPPRFQENVWSRIAGSQRAAPAAFWPALIQLISSSFTRPKVAYSYAAVFVALGIAAGSWTAKVKATRLETDLGQRYVQSLDPFLHEVASR